MHKVFCLLSGGIDSSTSLAIARDEFPNSVLEAVTIDYGQRHKREAEYAAIQAEAFGAEHFVLNARGMLEGMLIDRGIAANSPIPEVAYKDLAPGISPTYVTFRNGFFLSILAARAQAWVMAQEKGEFDRHIWEHAGQPMNPEGANAEVYVGVHADDGVNWAYPDCTPEFIGPMAAAIYIGTYHKVRVRAPLLFDTKIEVVAKGARLGVNFAETWSCYKGEEKQCGVCPTCRSRKEAFELNGLHDPTEYQA
jgi:7-cyano-7-deazaguanine synthase